MLLSVSEIELHSLLNRDSSQVTVLNDSHLLLTYDKMRLRWREFNELLTKPAKTDPNRVEEEHDADCN